MADERTQAHSLLDRVAQLGSQTGVVVGQGLNVRGSRVFVVFVFWSQKCLTIPGAWREGVGWGGVGGGERGALGRGD